MLHFINPKQLLSASLLLLMVLSFKVIFNHTSKRQFVVLHFRRSQNDLIFFKYLLELLEGDNILDGTYYHPNHINQAVSFVFDFQVKQRFQSWLCSFWTQFERITILHIESDFYGVTSAKLLYCSGIKLLNK